MRGKVCHWETLSSWNQLQLLSHCLLVTFQRDFCAIFQPQHVFSRFDHWQQNKLEIFFSESRESLKNLFAQSVWRQDVYKLSLSRIEYVSQAWLTEQTIMQNNN